jgi:hypothetical protein
MNYLNLVPFLPLFAVILVFCAGHVWWQRSQYRSPIPERRMTLTLLTREEKAVARDWMGG